MAEQTDLVMYKFMRLREFDDISLLVTNFTSFPFNLLRTFSLFRIFCAPAFFLVCKIE